MTAWTNIANGDVDQDSPGTQSLFTALRDNPSAIAEGADNSPMIHGLPNLVEVQEPTSDVSTITFAYDVTGMRGAVVEFIGRFGIGGGASMSMFLDVRESAGTWRRVYLSSSMTTGARRMQKLELTNLNNADGSGIVFCWAGEGGLIANYDRSSDDEASSSGGYSARSETIAEIRIGVDSGGEIEGSDSNERAIAKLYVIPEPTREQSL